MIDCKEYFAARGLRFASHTSATSYTTLPQQRSLPAFVTTQPQSQTVTHFERPSSQPASFSSLSHEPATTPILTQPSAIPTAARSVVSRDDVIRSVDVSGADGFSNAVSFSGSGSLGDFYEVRPGDNLYRIAKNNCTTVPILSHLNRITDPTKLDVGQILKLPSHSC